MHKLNVKSDAEIGRVNDPLASPHRPHHHKDRLRQIFLACSKGYQVRLVGKNWVVLGEALSPSFTLDAGLGILLLERRSWRHF